MAVKKGSTRKSGGARRPSPKSKALHAKLQRLYAQKVDLDLQIFELQMRLATSRDKAFGIGCVPTK